MNTYLKFLTYASPAVLVLGVIAGIYYFKYLGPVSRRILFYLIVSLCFDVLSRIIGSLNGNNLLLWPLLGLTELLIFGNFYRHLIKKKWWVWSLTTAGVVYIIAELIYIDANNVSAFQTYAKVVASFLIVLMTCILFMERIKGDEKIARSRMYLHFAILAYFSLNIILLLPINFLINESPEVIVYIWFVYLMSTVLFYLYLTYFIWKNGKSRKRSHYGLLS